MRAKVKICGITNRADAHLAARLGADFLGFNFYRRSPRYVEPDRAAQIIATLSETVIPVGLFVNPDREEITHIITTCHLPWVQLHGDEDAARCREVAALGVKVIKAIRLRRQEDLRLIEPYDTEAILLDAFHPDMYGGTGKRFDWNWLRDLSTGKEPSRVNPRPEEPTGTTGKSSAAMIRKVFLAGGLGPDNIAQALALGTWAVDLCSGVEARPGVKDAAKLERLFEEIGIYYGQR